MKGVIFGLSITSSWGNGHATTYRSLVRGLASLGHRILFLEHDQPWYAAHRDLADLPYARAEVYSGLGEVQERHAAAVRDADFVVVGSFVPDGVALGEWVIRTARGARLFYDIDTPVTLARLDAGGAPYLCASLIPRYDRYLSFTGGPVLEVVRRRYGARGTAALHCSADPAVHFPEPQAERWDLGYLGTYSEDRQPVLERLLLAAARRLPARRFALGGAQYPRDLAWPANVERIEHVPPPGHRAFYNAQRFTLNVTRRDMVRLGHSPSVRLFEAAACGTPVITDAWDGLEAFFKPGSEILVARSTDDVIRMLCRTTEAECQALGLRARARVLAQHTGVDRARQLVVLVEECGEAGAFRGRNDAGLRLAPGGPAQP